MTRTYIPCEHCFSSLIDVNATVSTLWLTLCDLAEPCDPFVTFETGIKHKESFLMDVAILEELGFIVSHEAGQSRFYVIKVLGFDRGCICVHRH